MDQSIELQKSFVTPDEKATLCCPKCGLIKIITVKKYREKKHTIKVKCQCNHGFTTLLDFRRHYRKGVEFEGNYSMLAPARGKGNLSVVNISRSGLGLNIAFTISADTTDMIQKGQKARIEFELDDKKKTFINKIVIIRYISGNYIGCEFEDPQELDKALGFYLTPTP